MAKNSVSPFDDGAGKPDPSLARESAANRATVVLTASDLFKNSQFMGFPEESSMSGLVILLRMDARGHIHLIEDDAAWDGSASWQAAEHAAAQDVANGRYQDFLSTDDFIESLTDSTSDT